MECASDYSVAVLVLGLVLIAFALPALIFAAINTRRSVLGGMLLEACADDWQTAVLAVDNVRLENNLMADALKAEKPRSGETLQ